MMPKEEKSACQRELNLAQMIEKALAMKLDISPTDQKNRDLLNCLHFFQYAIDHHQKGTDFVHLYSDFSNSDLYITPLAPQKVFKMSKNSIQTTLSETSKPQIRKPANVKIEHDRPLPSTIEEIDIPRTVSPSLSSLLCIPSVFVSRVDTVSSGERSLQSQIRALLGAVHCSSDLLILQRCVLYQSWDESSFKTCLIYRNTIILHFRQCSIDSFDLAIPLQTLFLWYNHRYSTPHSILHRLVQQSFVALPSLFFQKQANGRGRPKKQAETEKLRNLELQELRQDHQGLLLVSQLYLLREVVRELRNDRQGIPFVLEEGCVCGLLDNCWNKKCILASSPHLWTYAKSLVIVRITICYYE